jgi:hypothetical protein
VELTGTADGDGMVGLWGQLWYLDAGARLGRTFTSYTQRFFQTSYGGHSVSLLPFSDQEIGRRCADICMSIDTSEHFPLLDPVVVRREVELPPAARAKYREMERHFFAEIDGRDVSAPNAGVKSQKILQFASGAVYLDPLEDVLDPLVEKEWREVHREKIDELASIIGEMQGKPLIVVYEFASDLKRLKKAFPQGVVLSSQKSEDDFKAGRVPVLFAHPASAGHGIDGFHHVCHHIAFFSFNWSLRLHIQIVERIGPTRQYQAGYHRNVFIYLLVAKDTLDEDVIERWESRREISDSLRRATTRY